MAEHIVIRLIDSPRHQLPVPQSETAVETLGRILDGTHERVHGDWLRLEDGNGRWCRLDKIVEIYVEPDYP